MRGLETSVLLGLLFACLVLPLKPQPAGAGSVEACFGDCSGDGRVAVNELVVLVRIALGAAPLDSCEQSPPAAVPRIDDLVRAVRHLLVGCAAGIPTGTPTATALPTVAVDDRTLTAERVLRIEFVTTPPFVESLPNTLYALLGSGERRQAYGTMRGAIYDGSTLLGVSESSIGCCATGAYSFNPAPVTFRAPGSPWDFPAGDPATVDFTSMHDGSIAGRIDITIDAGSILLDLDAVALVFIHATYANGGSTIPPAPVLRSVRILGAAPGDPTPTATISPAVATAITSPTSGTTPTPGDDDD